jgi:TRAP-type C4-dicarboxylate transport system permease large subunit
MLLTLPIFVPLAKMLGFDLILWGVIILLALEIGFTTPPFGLLLFVMKGVAPPEISIKQVWAAATPFTLIVMAVLLLVVFVPWIATALVKLM